MARWHHAAWVAVAGLGLLAAGGCGGPACGPVEGTLRMNGKPLGNVLVEFLPEANGPRSTGVTDPAGNYRLTTLDGRPGAVVGRHRVVLSDLGVYEDKAPAPGEKKKRDIALVRPSRLPHQYSEVASTPLKKEVHAAPNTIDLDVTP
jgi:hypothetical protein